MNYEEKYNNLVAAIKQLREANPSDEGIQNWINDNVPELQESGDERIRNLIYCLIRDRSDNGKLLEHNGVSVEEALAWLERQKPSDAALEYLKENHSPSEVSDFQAAMNIAVAKAYDRGRDDAIAEMQKQDPCSNCDHRTMSCINFPCEKKQCEHNLEEPHWVHHKVDLSDCSEEYTKGYYDGWNNCNQQHAQVHAEQKPAKTAWSEEDSTALSDALWAIEQARTIAKDENDMGNLWYAERWLNSLKERVQPTVWKPTDEQMADLWNMVCECRPADQQLLQDIYYGLKTLKEE